MRSNFKQSWKTWAALMAPTLVTTTALAADPAEATDDTWITVSGTVVSSTPDSFRLDHGSGVITVEMDDFDSYADGYAIFDNDEVVVHGKVDHDLFEKKTIEASSVFVENLGTYFYASALDDEAFNDWTVSLPVILGQVEVTGTVTEVKGTEVMVDVGPRQVQVDTAALGYDPLDDSGFLKIEKGDRIKAAGHIDNDVFERREVMADWIVELQD